jgi:hypothetical protein
MNICVYGASSTKIDPLYITAGEEFGRKIAQRGHGLVFGGGATGMMGAAARGVFSGHGNIIGIAPAFFNVDGVLFEKCNEMIKPETMRERKRLMEENSDAFVVTPGGIGTLDEFYEILTLKQLGQHKKPIAIYNINNYYDDLLNMMAKSIHTNFAKANCTQLYFVSDDPDAILDYLESYEYDGLGILDFKDV